MNRIAKVGILVAGLLMLVSSAFAAATTNTITNAMGGVAIVISDEYGVHVSSYTPPNAPDANDTRSYVAPVSMRVLTTAGVKATQLAAYPPDDYGQFLYLAASNKLFVADNLEDWVEVVISANGTQLDPEVVVTTTNILDGTVVNADIDAAAAIALTKLGTGVLGGSVVVNTTNILDGTVVNADIDAAAAIAESKLSISGYTGSFVIGQGIGTNYTLVITNGIVRAVSP